MFSEKYKYKPEHRVGRRYPRLHSHRQVPCHEGSKGHCLECILRLSLTYIARARAVDYSSTAACAAAKRAIGTRKGEQEA